MFNKLLKALFGPRAPTDLARSSQARWEAWLLPVRDGAPTGDDPSYDDAFLAIKDEVAKLSDIDDALIVDAAERLLKTVAKDVRLAVYYLYGRMRRDGAEGVGDGFELLSALIDRYDAQLLPARVESRKAALEWLAGSTFTDRLERVHGLVGAPLERTMSSLALILARTAQWPEGARPSLEGLTRRLAGRVESPGSGTNAMIDRSRLPQTAPVSAVPTLAE
jgi:type VI secretion system protein VasJ